MIHYHRTPGGFYLRIGRWQLHCTFRRVNRLLERIAKDAAQTQPQPPQEPTP